MLSRLNAIITTWPFLLSLTLLLLNDGWLKAAHPGFVTGKLSDFAGITVVALLLLAIYPRRYLRIAGGLAMGFLWWKSPASDGFIEAFNQLGWFRIGRTVDYGDLTALAVLPLCRALNVRRDRYAIPWPLLRRALLFPIMAATLFGILGTSSIPTVHEYVVRPIAATETLQRKAVADVIYAVATAYGLTCRDCQIATEAGNYSDADRDSRSGVTLRYKFLNTHAVSFHITAYPSGIVFGTAGSQKAHELREAIKRALAERFKGLEYIEPLCHRDDGCSR
jgi:hypothetical protein